MTGVDLLAELTADGELVTERLEHWARSARPEVPDYGETGLAMSYAEFAARVAAIAGNLAGMGVGKGDHVSVFCFDPLLSAQAMFGVWRQRRLLSRQLLVHGTPARLPAQRHGAGCWSRKGGRPAAARRGRARPR